MESPSLSRSFLFFRSSLQLNQNTLSINWLTMTEHPLIPLSVMLSKLLLNQPSAFVPPEEVLQMKGGWKDDTTCPFTTEAPTGRHFNGRWKEEGRNNTILVDVVIRVSISAILYCCPSLVLLSLQYIKTKHYVFKKAQI